MNFQGVAESQTQLKSFVDDLGENAEIGFSESWLALDDDLYLWNVASATREIFRCVRCQNNERKDSGVMIFVLIRIAPKRNVKIWLFLSNPT